MVLVRRGTTAAVWVLGAIVLLSAIAVGSYFGGKFLWEELAGYISNGTTPENATRRKDVVNLLVLIGAGIVGTLTALAAVGNLIFSRMNLQNARDTLRQQYDLDGRRAQDDALQAYFQQLGGLLTEQKLMQTKSANDPLRLLARAQTLTVLGRLGARRKKDLLLFLYGAGLIRKNKAVVTLFGADLSHADLSSPDLSDADVSDEYEGLVMVYVDNGNPGGTTLSDADLRGVNLSDANLRNADLRNADLSRADLSDANLSSARLSSASDIFTDRGSAMFKGADLSGADVRGADLSDANLRGTNLIGADLSGARGWTEGQLTAAEHLEGATMPYGQKYEDWLKSRVEEGEDSGTS